MVRYEDIVFLQGDDADKALDLLQEIGEDAAVEYLMQWDYGESPLQEREEFPWGTLDHNYKSGFYVMSYNLAFGYIGLIKTMDY